MLGLDGRNLLLLVDLLDNILCSTIYRLTTSDLGIQLKSVPAPGDS